MDGIIDGLRADDAAAVQQGVEGLSWAIVGAAAPGRIRATRDMPPFK